MVIDRIELLLTGISFLDNILRWRAKDKAKADEEALNQELEFKCSVTHKTRVFVNNFEKEALHSIEN